MNKNPLAGIIRAEWQNLGDRKKHFMLYMILFTIAGAISLLTPLVIGMIFNTIQESITTKVELIRLLKMISLLLVIELGFWAFHGSARMMEQATGFIVQRNFTNKKVGKVLDLPIKWHKDNHSGDTIDKIERSAGGVGNFSKFMTFQVVYGITSILGSIIALLFIDLTAAILAVIFSTVVLIVIMRIDVKLNKKYKELNELGNKAAAAMFDYISNIITIITLRMKKTVREEIDNKIMASYKTHKKASIINEFKWGFASTSITLMTVIVLIIRAYKDFTTTGIILVGTMYMLYGYLARVGNTFYTFAEVYGQIVMNNASIENAKVIDEEFNKIKAEVNAKLPERWNEITIKNLEFTYDEAGNKKHLEGVTIRMMKGQKIALVGESGSGKSTVLALIRGLYNPDKASVYCDGKLLEHGLARIKNNVTLIPQDPEIFNNTIRYNVTMGTKVNKELLTRTIEMARFKKVAERLDKGIDTNVMEKGVSLSGGEKQRLALARGLLAARNSDIVLLDEPTSSVDSINEIKIHENLFKEFHDKTIISSIHRLHLLPRFDYIYLFEKGRVIAEGSLKDIKKNPKFMSIWRKYLTTKVKNEKSDD